MMNQRNVASFLRQGMAVILCLLGIMALQVQAGGIEIAEDLLVDLRSEDLAAGAVTEWPNHGSLGGIFTAVGQPIAENVGDWEENVVRFDGASYFSGPVSPAGITGSDTVSIEVWAYNTGVSEDLNANEYKEEGMVGWGWRTNGRNRNFTWGYKSFGAAAHYADDYDTAWGEGVDDKTHTPFPALNTWWHLVYTYDGATTRCYVNGVLAAEKAMTLNVGGGIKIYVGAQSNGSSSGLDNGSRSLFTGAIAQVRIHDGVLTPEQILYNAQIRIQAAGTSSRPSPENKESNVVLRDLMLSWEPGENPGTHTVYLSEDVNAVAEGIAEVASGLTAPSHDPGPLAYDTAYFWRVDEVNDSPDKTVYEGKVWSFTTERYANLVPVDVNKATASSSDELFTPAMTVNGSGLTGLEHSSAMKDMWASGNADTSPWLMYEFDKVENLDTMLFWNANQQFELLFGLGAKDVDIMYSVDGVTWTTLAEPKQLNQGPGQPGYTPQTVDFGQVPAKFVKLNILSKWGDPTQPGYCVSEVQFYSIPVSASNPIPETDATDIDPDSMIEWRAGREVAQHVLYLSDDQAAVADGTAASVTIPYPTNSAELSPYDLQLGTTYYWRVDEVNEAETPSIWEGPVWNLTTLPYVTVDDFESYTDSWGSVVFQTWIDGYGWNDGAGNIVEGNGTGSAVGYFPPPTIEKTIKYGGEQSMPLTYGLDGKTLSETTATLPEAIPANKHGITTLSLQFYGTETNVPGQLFVKINGTKVSDYPGSQDDMKLATWHPWTIDVAAAGITSIQSMTIGITGGNGMIYIDAIRLTAE